MSYELILDNEAIELLQKLEKPLRARIFRKMQSAKEDPYHFFKKLEGRTDFKMRVGDYRVIADIDASKKRIEVTCIGHRKNIYKNS